MLLFVAPSAILLCDRDWLLNRSFLGVVDASRENYHKSKVVHALKIARYMQNFMGATWCLAESGATGPTFAPPDMTCSFSVVAVVGPSGIQVCKLYESDHNDREKSMWQFTAAALQLLEKCVSSADNVHPRL
eukprot:SAG31_NODE_1673_length_7560_cov_3.528749_2_plen_132_part_00